ncbi:hypothetical protein [Arsenicicoccus bolidensis]|uniref:hypothetical protein n=1 Tax=Arsenicicoccus bolidensis TaxID=229480 RepID=UPI0028ACE71B|nr:hypothetical protein [Arsenicicoccus bolidensis]
MRAGRWGIAALTAALLAACGGGGSPGAQSAKTVTVTASPTSTSATAAPASTAASGTASASATPGATATSTATGGSATKQIVLTLPNPDGGWKVEESADALSCGGEPSLVATSARTYHCGPSAASAVACVADNGGSHILCAMQPWARKATRFSVDGTLPTTSKPANPVPLGIELADGSRWFIRSGGAWPPGPQETAAMYSCSEGCGGESEALLTAPGNLDDFGLIKEGDIWYARRGPLGYDTVKTGKITKERITKAWFIRAAPSSGSSGGTGATGALGPVTRPNLTIAEPSDVQKLPNTNGLRAFARAQLAQVTKESDGCPMTITVEALDAQSSAMVSEFGSGCGGGMAMWGVKKGRWIKVWSGQDVPLCSELRAKGAVLNPNVIGRCSGPAPAFTAQRYTP